MLNLVEHEKKFYNRWAWSQWHSYILFLKTFRNCVGGSLAIPARTGHKTNGLQEEYFAANANLPLSSSIEIFF